MAKRATVEFRCGLTWRNVTDCDAVVRGKSAAEARKNMREHRRSAHPGFRSPKGSISSRVPKLD